MEIEKLRREITEEYNILKSLEKIISHVSKPEKAVCISIPDTEELQRIGSGALYQPTPMIEYWVDTNSHLMSCLLKEKELIEKEISHKENLLGFLSNGKG